MISFYGGMELFCWAVAIVFVLRWNHMLAKWSHNAPLQFQWSEVELPDDETL